MRKSLSIVVLLGVLAGSLVLVAGSYVVKAESKTIIVPDDYPTIQAAIESATAGDTVFVKKGVYQEFIEITKPLSLVGEHRAGTIIMGKGEVYRVSPPLINIDAPNVTVSGFTITHNDNVGIAINPASVKCTIKNNTITETGDGIHIYEVQAYATGLVYSTNIQISGNYVANNSGFGVYCSSRNTTISDNTIAFNGAAGLIIDSASNITVRYNSIRENGQSDGDPALMARILGGLYLRWVGPFDVHGNNITENIGYGIQFGEGCNNASVYENNIERNDIGIKLLNFLAVADATFGRGNTFYKNNILNNSEQALIENNLDIASWNSNFTGINGTDLVFWDNGEMGNYWSDYQTKYPNATEVGSSGIGDTPYVINSDNKDRYPFMKAVVIPEFPLTILALLAFASILIAAWFRKRKAGR
jgi:parallel beta-helix repeat protein